MFISCVHQRRVLIILVSVLFGMVGTGTAQASCGLDMCPMHVESSASESPLRPSFRARMTSVNSTAGYVETVAGLSFAVYSRLRLGVQIPIVAVQQGDSGTAGLGNMIAMGNWSVLDRQDDLVLDLGVQLEVPTVSNPALGDGHFLLLPTVQAGWHPGSVIMMAVLGWGRALEGEHHHHAGGSIVNPHANSELLLRLDGGRSWELGQGSIRGTIRADTIQVLGHSWGGDLIVTTGPTLGFNGERLNSELFLLIPATEAERYQMRAGIRLGLRLR
jgi:hypothetical protein